MLFHDELYCNLCNHSFFKPAEQVCTQINDGQTLFGDVLLRDSCANASHYFPANSQKAKLLYLDDVCVEGCPKFYFAKQEENVCTDCTSTSFVITTTKQCVLKEELTKYCSLLNESSRTCVESCGAFLLDRLCVDQCPSGYFIAKQQCQPSCAAFTLLLGSAKFCQNYSDMFFVHDNVLISECNTQYVLINNVRYCNWCPRYFSTETLGCSDSCYGLTFDNKICSHLNCVQSAQLFAQAALRRMVFRNQSACVASCTY